jgi:hypothetical protein
VIQKDAVFTEFDEGVTEVTVLQGDDGTYMLERRVKVSALNHNHAHVSRHLAFLTDVYFRILGDHVQPFSMVSVHFASMIMSKRTTESQTLYYSENDDLPSYKAEEHLIQFAGTFLNTNGLKLQWIGTPDMLDQALGSKLTVAEVGALNEQVSTTASSACQQFRIVHLSITHLKNDRIVSQVILSFPCSCEVSSGPVKMGFCEMHCVKFHNPPLQVYKAAAAVRGPVMLNDGCVP